MSPYDGMKVAAALRLLLRTGLGRQRSRAAMLRVEAAWLRANATPANNGPCAAGLR